jgi:hypothetical protein
MMIMTYEPTINRVVAMLNAEMTPLDLTDPVVQNVYRYETKRSANPYDFSHPIYSPRKFLLKYNGYNFKDNNVYEHRLWVDLENNKLMYDREGDETQLGDLKLRVTYDIIRAENSILAEPIAFDAVKGQAVDIPEEVTVEFGDIFATQLFELQESEWQQVGSDVERQVLEGAPFTFGRALGLGSENLGSGSQIYLDGAAVFNRVLSDDELEAIKFIEGAVKVKNVRSSVIDKPRTFALSQNFPNPFNPFTKIRYSLPRSEYVRIDVFNSTGQKVATLVEGKRSAGYHEVAFNATGLSSGLYIYKLKAGSFEQCRKMIILQ